jgi:hypothetical protein
MARTALFSPSVLSSAAAGCRLPTLEVTLAFVMACGGDVAEWRRRWLSVAGGLGGMTPAAVRVSGTRGELPQQAVMVPIQRCGPPPPAQLPVAPHFVGRSAELEVAQALLAPGTGPRRPLVISGPVGIGKTAFALRLAAELATELCDGQLYADLGGSGAELAPSLQVLAGFLAALGVAESAVPAQPAQQIALYRSLLASRRLLVLLDDAADEGQVRPLLAQSPRSQIVVTCRARLAGLDGANRVHLDVLARTDSVAMIAAVAGRGIVGADLHLMHRLAELCGDLPLALSIVAKKIEARPGWPLAYTASQLAGGDRLLDRLRVGDLNLRSRLMSTYGRQHPMARAVFRQLGASRSAYVTAAAVAARWALPIECAEDQIEALLDAGLLRRASAAGRYGILPLFQLFASELPVDTDSYQHFRPDLRTPDWEEQAG